MLSAAKHPVVAVTRLFAPLRVTIGCHAERSEASRYSGNEKLFAPLRVTIGCHAERSEASRYSGNETLRSAQSDNRVSC